MTDRELLALAAKAAGLSVHYGNLPHQRDMLFLDDGGEFSPEWNPITDDGDALRLAVKLSITVMPEPEAYPPCIVAVWYAGRLASENITEHQDRYAAARRAIVRAAAAAMAYREKP